MKKLILLSLVCGSAMLASADILYWMVDKPTYQEDSRSFTFAYASLLASNDGGKNFSEIETVVAESPTSTGAQASSLGNYVGDAWSFYVELLNDQGEDMAQIKNIGTYASLVNGNYLKNSQMQTAMSTLPVGSFNVPEPTSGLLMLLGVGLLGLKRKKV